MPNHDTSPSLRDLLAWFLAASDTAPSASLENLEQHLCHGLGQRSITALTCSLLHWRRWNINNGQDQTPFSSTVVREYLNAQDAAGASPSSVAVRIWAVRRLLRALGSQDDDTVRVLRGAARAKSVINLHRSRQPHVTAPTGWVHVRRLMQHASRDSPVQIKTVAALLVFYDSLARVHEIFGLRAFDGGWRYPPARRNSLTRLQGGRGSLTLPSGRSVALSPAAMEWLELSFAGRPSRGGPLFTAAATERPWGATSWRTSLSRMLQRTETPSFCVRSLRVGAIQDMLNSKMHPYDVAAIGGWQTLRPILRQVRRPERPRRSSRYSSHVRRVREIPSPQLDLL